MDKKRISKLMAGTRRPFNQMSITRLAATLRTDSHFRRLSLSPCQDVKTAGWLVVVDRAVFRVR
jgi:hypothetical protein